MEMKSRVIQLCIDVSTWNMVAIFGLGHIQVKEEIDRIVTAICHKGAQSFRDQEQTCLHNWCIG